jgi:hypothetical protein
MATTVNGVVLELHNGARTECLVKLQVTSECGYCRNHNHHLVLLAVAGSTYNALDDSCADLVLDGLLLITGGCNEELVLDIDEVLAVPDDLAVGVLN